MSNGGVFFALFFGAFIDCVLATSSAAVVSYRSVIVEGEVYERPTRKVPQIRPAKKPNTLSPGEGFKHYGKEFDEMGVPLSEHLSAEPSARDLRPATQFSNGGSQLGISYGNAQAVEWMGDSWGSLGFERDFSRYESIQRRNLKLWTTLHQENTAGDFDFNNLRRHAGMLAVGTETSLGLNLRSEWKLKNVAFAPYGQFNQRKFEPEAELTGTVFRGQSRDISLGMVLRGDFSDSAQWRNHVSSQWLYRMEAPLAQRIQNTFTANFWDSSASPKIWKEADDWNVDFDAIVSLRWPQSSPWGIGFGLERNVPLLDPLLKYGDGGMIAPSPELKNERNHRAAVGPRYQSERFLGSLNYFREQLEDSVVIAGTTPTKAKAQNLGGIWVQGVEISLKYAKPLWEMGLKGGFQEALNASRIKWQTGQDVPGRPKSWALAFGSAHWGAWEVGSQLAFKGPQPLDLSGLWYLDESLDLGAQLGYKYRLFTLKLVGSHLNRTGELDRNGELAFLGAVGPQVLEPLLPVPEVKLLVSVDL